MLFVQRPQLLVMRGSRSNKHKHTQLLFWFDFLWHFFLWHPKHFLAICLHWAFLWRVTQNLFRVLLSVKPFMTIESEKSEVWLTISNWFYSLATSWGRTNTQKFDFGLFRREKSSISFLTLFIFRTFRGIIKRRKSFERLAMIGRIRCRRCLGVTTRHVFFSFPFLAIELNLFSVQISGFYHKFIF